MIISVKFTLNYFYLATRLIGIDFQFLTCNRYNVLNEAIKFHTIGIFHVSIYQHYYIEYILGYIFNYYLNFGVYN